MATTRTKNQITSKNQKLVVHLPSRYREIVDRVCKDTHRPTMTNGVVYLLDLGIHEHNKSANNLATNQNQRH
jgi:hypothetical protein